MNEHDLSEEAIRYVKKHQKELIDHFVGIATPSKTPVSIFMAGSPGAGKTEASKYILESIPESTGRIVRIDPDEIRLWLPQYIPGRAELFQGAVSVGVNKLHDYVKHHDISFLLDGTFSNYAQARNNVALSLRKDRPVSIQYVVQPPQTAWGITQEREKIEGRNILKEDFIRHYIEARKTVLAIKQEFGDLVNIDLLERDVRKNTYTVYLNVNVHDLDAYLPKKYSEDDLINML